MMYGSRASQSWALRPYAMIVVLGFLNSRCLSGFIADSNSHFVCSSIVRPLTERKRASFVSLWGGRPVDYFVSLSFSFQLCKSILHRWMMLFFVSEYATFNCQCKSFVFVLLCVAFAFVNAPYMVFCLSVLFDALRIQGLPRWGQLFLASFGLSGIMQFSSKAPTPGSVWATGLICLWLGIRRSTKIVQDWVSVRQWPCSMCCILSSMLGSSCKGSSRLPMSQVFVGHIWTIDSMH